MTRSTFCVDRHVGFIPTRIVWLTLLLLLTCSIAEAQRTRRPNRPQLRPGSVGSSGAPASPDAATESRLKRHTWMVDGVEREALIAGPATTSTQPAPVVFAFHGHGGSMQRAATMFRMHDVWPEAVTVYMQGLNTPGMLTDPEGKLPGWQSWVGAQGDRDLKFFDAVLASVKSNYSIDERRVYATGHSNGGSMTYTLWEARGDLFAAVAPSAAAGPGVMWTQRLKRLQPKPVMHLAGERDALVKYEWQQKTMDALREINHSDAAGREWDRFCTIYTSETNPPVITLIHPGAHNYPQQAPELIVRFFKEHALPRALPEAAPEATVEGSDRLPETGM